jgi:hypothetical protein
MCTARSAQAARHSEWQLLPALIDMSKVRMRQRQLPSTGGSTCTGESDMCTARSTQAARHSEWRLLALIDVYNVPYDSDSNPALVAARAQASV